MEKFFCGYLSLNFENSFDTLALPSQGSAFPSNSEKPRQQWRGFLF